MARDWETWLKNSIGPASATEEQDRDRTERRIRDAIAADVRLQGNVRVFVRGSYANNTNVRQDSDVDIAVEWKQWHYVTKVNDATDLSWPQLGVTLNGDLGPQPSEYRQWVEGALISVLGSSNVEPKNTAILVRRNSSSLDADIVPCFRLVRHTGPGRTDQGNRLYSRSGSSIVNWPDQHLMNGRAKNNQTQRRFKQIIRALKRLENDMMQKRLLPNEVDGYFMECLLYNLSNSLFQGLTYKGTAEEVLARLWKAANDNEHTDWVEANGMKWLWRDGQKWTPAEASDFAYRAWNYIHAS
jgi:predicted nucleotidyltransferase